MSKDVIYNLTVECMNCFENSTFGYSGYFDPLYEPPQPKNITYCPQCGEEYEEDLLSIAVGIDIMEAVHD